MNDKNVTVPSHTDCVVPKGSKRHFLPFSTFQGLWHNSR